MYLKIWGFPLRRLEYSSWLPTDGVPSRHIIANAGDHSKWDQILSVKLGKHIVFCGSRRSYILGPPVIDSEYWKDTARKMKTKVLTSGVVVVDTLPLFS